MFTTTTVVDPDQTDTESSPLCITRCFEAVPPSEANSDWTTGIEFTAMTPVQYGNMSADERSDHYVLMLCGAGTSVDESVAETPLVVAKAWGKVPRGTYELHTTMATPVSAVQRKSNANGFAALSAKDPSVLASHRKCPNTTMHVFGLDVGALAESIENSAPNKIVGMFYCCPLMPNGLVVRSADHSIIGLAS